MAFTLFCPEFGNVVNNAFLVLIFWVQKLGGANFTRFCNYVSTYISRHVITFLSWAHLWSFPITVGTLDHQSHAAELSREFTLHYTVKLSGAESAKQWQTAELSQSCNCCPNRPLCHFLQASWNWAIVAVQKAQARPKLLFQLLLLSLPTLNS